MELVDQPKSDKVLFYMMGQKLLEFLVTGCYGDWQCQDAQEDIRQREEQEVRKGLLQPVMCPPVSLIQWTVNAGDWGQKTSNTADLLSLNSIDHFYFLGTS